MTAASTQVDDGDDTGPFSPPDEKDMLKFEAKDAIDKPPIEDEKDVLDTGTDLLHLYRGLSPFYLKEMR